MVVMNFIYNYLLLIKDISLLNKFLLIKDISPFNYDPPILQMDPFFPSLENRKLHLFCIPDEFLPIV
jgi:hypothetical protein